MLKFAASRHNWTAQNWRRFFFINKSPFRGIVLRKLLVGLTGFTWPLHVPNLTLCLDLRSSVKSWAFLHSDFVEKN